MGSINLLRNGKMPVRNSYHSICVVRNPVSGRVGHALYLPMPFDEERLPRVIKDLHKDDRYNS